MIFFLKTGVIPCSMTTTSENNNQKPRKAQQAYKADEASAQMYNAMKEHYDARKKELEFLKYLLQQDPVARKKEKIL